MQVRNRITKQEGGPCIALGVETETGAPGAPIRRIRAMTGDQHVTTASGPGHSRTSRCPRPDTRLVTHAYRRARLSVVLALLLLAGTAAYLVAQQQQQTWGYRHSGTSTTCG